MLARLRILAVLFAAIVALSAAAPSADAAVLRLAMTADSPRAGGILHLSVTVSPLRRISYGSATIHFSTGNVTVRLVRATSTRYRAAIRVPSRARIGRVSVGLRIRTSAGLLLTGTRYATILAPLPAPTPTPPVMAPTPTPMPTPSAPAVSPPAAGAPRVGDCAVFPADNVWNESVSTLPVAADSATLIGSIGASTGLHPDFGSYAGYGIPFNVVNASTPKESIAFQYAGESDPGPYPIPANPAIEGGPDAHLLVVDSATCTLYETWATATDGNGHWTAGSGAIWSLASNALRPDGWTSADAAGLPILPGLVRSDEVAAGFIGHAIRFTAVHTQAAHIYPARHDASSLTGGGYPPMGLRVRMKASYDISGLPPQAKVIAQAMKTYGMILADNGSNWYFQGASDPSFSDDQLNALKAVPGSAFEVVDTTGLVNGP